jgi:hypothetical protein
LHPGGITAANAVSGFLGKTFLEIRLGHQSRTPSA